MSDYIPECYDTPSFLTSAPRVLPQKLRDMVRAGELVVSGFPNTKLPKDFHIVAVYGTLRRGWWNNFLLKERSAESVVHLGRAKTISQNFVFISESIPYMLDGADFLDGEVQNSDRGPIIVELYAVAPDVLRVMDRLERHPRWYVRGCVPVLSAASGEQLNPWCYLMPRMNMPPSAKPLSARAKTLTHDAHDFNDGQETGPQDIQLKGA